MSLSNNLSSYSLDTIGNPEPFNAAEFVVVICNGCNGFGNGTSVTDVNVLNDILFNFTLPTCSRICFSRADVVALIAVISSDGATSEANFFAASSAIRFSTVLFTGEISSDSLL